MAKKPAMALTLTACFFLLISLSHAQSSSLTARDRQFGVDLTDVVVSGHKDIKILLPSEKLPAQSSDSTTVVNLEVEDKPTEPEIVSDEKNLPASGFEAVEDIGTPARADVEDVSTPQETGGDKHENVMEVRFPRSMMPMPHHHHHSRWAWLTSRFWFPRKKCGGRMHRHRHHPDGHGPFGIPMEHRGEEMSGNYQRFQVREMNHVPFYHHRMREGGEEGMMIGEFKRPHFGFFHHRHHHDREMDEEHHHHHHDRHGDEMEEHHHHRHLDHDDEEHRHHHHHDHDDGEFEGREPHRRRFGMWRKMKKAMMTEF